MSVGTLTAQQLRSLVEDTWQRDADAVAVGLHVARPWRLPEAVEFEFGTATVVRADTVFRVRQVLLDAERRGGRVILLTRLQEGELGKDVVGRLARSKLHPINLWVTLCSLFKARDMDRSACDASLAEALLEAAPADGYPPVSTGVLDAGTVWRAACRHVFEMGDREPDLVTLLLWASGPAAQTRYLSVGEELRGGLRERLVATLGDPAGTVLRFLDSRAGTDAVALAAACQIVFGDGREEVLSAAAARMEQYHQNTPVPPAVGRALGRAAADAVADLDRADDHRSAQWHLQRADELLRQFHCEDHAHRSRLTLAGYEQRLARFGRQVQAALAGPTPDEIRRCEELQAEVAAHRRARVGTRGPEQVARTQMAVRLLRWLSAPLPAATSFAELAAAYRGELAFVDWARESVCRGEDVADLTHAYRDLDRAVLARRDEFNRTFAASLADWAATGSTAGGVCGVEGVLGRVVAPVAAAGNRVLLVVLDGMSWAVCHELLADIRHDHWAEATPAESSTPFAPVIATVPSVTAFSRTSLLSGELAEGDAATEKRNFEAHDALRRACDKRHPPVLFHKREVTEGPRGVVGDELSKAILSANHRVVGVVINAVDDRLSGAQQVRDAWTVGRIGPLGAVLKLARDSGRVVILASDHGHVWHRAEARPHAGVGRWRTADGDVRDGELVIAGDRVRDGGGGRSVVVPWTETVYYGKPQNGYHGGVTPQEMVCPLVILTDRTSSYDGLSECHTPEPGWWSPAPAAATAAAEEPPVAVRVPRKPTGLFDEYADEEPTPGHTPAAPPAPTPPTDGTWLDRLFASAGYKGQKEAVRRHAPEDGLVRRCLEALAAAGGIMTPAAFSHAASVPPARLDGLVALVQRLLNVDGYDVLTFSRPENRIELNVVKLKRQFDLG